MKRLKSFLPGDVRRARNATGIHLPRLRLLFPSTFLLLLIAAGRANRYRSTGIVSRQAVDVRAMAKSYEVQGMSVVRCRLLIAGETSGLLPSSCRVPLQYWLHLTGL